MNITNISTLKPFGRFCVSLGMIPTSYKESMSYEEQLLWFCNYLETEVIPKYNENVETINELIVLYNQLKEYVDNYFENLDVQEEINNKLDDMAESGQLTDIIAQYLQLAGVLAYNTLSEMTEALNIVEGSTCYILGQDTYNDGKGAFYKIRTVTSGDVVDGFNIVALDVSDTLIGERLPNYYISDLNDKITNINGDIEDINNDIEEINNKLTYKLNKKFTKANIAYNTNLDLTGNGNGLSFEIFKRKQTGSALSLQGQAIDKQTGTIYHNTNNEIYTLSDTQLISKTTVYSGDYGHGGDCCIHNGKMYISDSENNNLYIVDLSNGTKTTISLDNSEVLNEDHTDYTPKFAGVYMDDTDDYVYLCYCDEENNDHSIKTGSTVRFYKYTFTTETYEKLFEVEQNIVYIQGATQDEDYIYFIGNKPFTTTYTGNELYIIDKKDYSIYDVLENNTSYETEGLDYGYYDGVEGLLTACCYSGTNMFFGMYAFGSNCAEVLTIKDTPTEQAYSVKSKGGVVITYVRIQGNFVQNTTYTYDHFFDGNYPMKMGGGGWTGMMFAVSYHGSNRNHQGQAEWDNNTNQLIIRTLSTTTQSDYVDLIFVYVSE